MKNLRVNPPTKRGSIISVWWDLDNCTVPKTFDSLTLVRNIRSALVQSNFSGRIQIFAYAAKAVKTSLEQSLEQTGVNLSKITGSKDVLNKRMMADMMNWAFDHPPPATYFLLSGDSDFSHVLHLIGHRNYTILLAHPSNAASEAPTEVASTIWKWEALRSGGKPSPKPQQQVIGAIHILTSEQDEAGYEKKPELGAMDEKSLEIELQDVSADKAGETEHEITQTVYCSCGTCGISS